MIGLLQGAGGVFGILGAVVYPRVRRWLGLPTAGLCGLCVLAVCLTPCLVSVWLPGSPFDPFGHAQNIHTGNCTGHESGRYSIYHVPNLQIIRKDALRRAAMASVPGTAFSQNMPKVDF